MSSPVVLDLIICAAGQSSGNSRPPVAPARVEVEDEALFLGGHAAAFEAGVEIVNPAQPAALACSVETYNNNR